MAFVFPSGVEGNKGAVSPAHSAEPDGGRVLKAVKGFITRQKQGYVWNGMQNNDRFILFNAGREN